MELNVWHVEPDGANGKKVLDVTEYNVLDHFNLYC